MDGIDGLGGIAFLHGGDEPTDATPAAAGQGDKGGNDEPEETVLSADPIDDLITQGLDRLKTALLARLDEPGLRQQAEEFVAELDHTVRARRQEIDALLEHERKVELMHFVREITDILGTGEDLPPEATPERVVNTFLVRFALDEAPKTLRSHVEAIVMVEHPLPEPHEREVRDDVNPMEFGSPVHGDDASAAAGHQDQQLGDRTVPLDAEPPVDVAKSLVRVRALGMMTADGQYRALRADEAAVGVGSGVVFHEGPEHYDILTAMHEVNPYALPQSLFNPPIEVTLPDGTRTEGVVVVGSRLWEPDVAVVRIWKERSSDVIQPIPLADEALLKEAMEAEVTIFGYPSGQTSLGIVRGKVLKTTEPAPREKALIIHAPTTTGFSGGPAIYRNHIVGIVGGYSEAGQTAVVSVESIRELLGNQWDSQHETGTPAAVEAPLLISHPDQVETFSIKAQGAIQLAGWQPWYVRRIAVFRWSIFRPSTLAQHLLEELRQLASAQGQRLSTGRGTITSEHSVEIALRDAIENALVHGSLLDPEKLVTVRWSLEADRLAIEVVDQGTRGFPAPRPTFQDPDKAWYANVLTGTKAHYGLQAIEEGTDEAAWEPLIGPDDAIVGLRVRLVWNVLPRSTSVSPDVGGSGQANYNQPQSPPGTIAFQQQSDPSAGGSELLTHRAGRPDDQGPQDGERAHYAPEDNGDTSAAAGQKDQEEDLGVNREGDDVDVAHLLKEGAVGPQGLTGERAFLEADRSPTARPRGRRLPLWQWLGSWVGLTGRPSGFAVGVAGREEVVGPEAEDKEPQSNVDNQQGQLSITHRRYLRLIQVAYTIITKYITKPLTESHGRTGTASSGANTSPASTKFAELYSARESSRRWGSIKAIHVSLRSLLHGVKPILGWLLPPAVVGIIALLRMSGGNEGGSRGEPEGPAAAEQPEVRSNRERGGASDVSGWNRWMLSLTALPVVLLGVFPDWIGLLGVVAPAIAIVILGLWGFSRRSATARGVLFQTLLTVRSAVARHTHRLVLSLMGGSVISTFVQYGIWEATDHGLPYLAFAFTGPLLMVLLLPALYVALRIAKPRWLIEWAGQGKVDELLRQLDLLGLSLGAKMLMKARLYRDVKERGDKSPEEVARELKRDFLPALRLVEHVAGRPRLTTGMEIYRPVGPPRADRALARANADVVNFFSEVSMGRQGDVRYHDLGRSHLNVGFNDLAWMVGLIMLGTLLTGAMLGVFWIAQAISGSPSWGWIYAAVITSPISLATLWVLIQPVAPKRLKVFGIPPARLEYRLLPASTAVMALLVDDLIAHGLLPSDELHTYTSTFGERSDRIPGEAMIAITLATVFLDHPEDAGPIDVPTAKGATDRLGLPGVYYGQTLNPITGRLDQTFHQVSIHNKQLAFRAEVPPAWREAFLGLPRHYQPRLDGDVGTLYLYPADLRRKSALLTAAAIYPKPYQELRGRLEDFYQELGLDGPSLTGRRYRGDWAPPHGVDPEFLHNATEALRMALRGPEGSDADVMRHNVQRLTHILDETVAKVEARLYDTDLKRRIIDAVYEGEFDEIIPRLKLLARSADAADAGEARELLAAVGISWLDPVVGGSGTHPKGDEEFVKEHLPADPSAAAGQVVTVLYGPHGDAADFAQMEPHLEQARQEALRNGKRLVVLLEHAGPEREDFVRRSGAPAGVGPKEFFERLQDDAQFRQRVRDEFEGRHARLVAALRDVEGHSKEVLTRAHRAQAPGSFGRATYGYLMEHADDIAVLEEPYDFRGWRLGFLTDRHHQQALAAFEAGDWPTYIAELRAGYQSQRRSALHRDRALAEHIRDLLAGRPHLVLWVIRGSMHKTMLSRLLRERGVDVREPIAPQFSELMPDQQLYLSSPLRVRLSQSDERQLAQTYPLGQLSWMYERLGSERRAAGVRAHEVVSQLSVEELQAASSVVAARSTGRPGKRPPETLLQWLADAGKIPQGELDAFFRTYGIRGKFWRMLRDDRGAWIPEPPGEPAPAATGPGPLGRYAARMRRQLIKRLRKQGFDEHVLQAMGRVPREAFIPDEIVGSLLLPERLRSHSKVALAYEEQIELQRPPEHGEHRVPYAHIGQPFIVAWQLDALGLQSRERSSAPRPKILEVGTGEGYQAAVLAELGAEVDTVEFDHATAQTAERRLQEHGYRQVHVRQGNGYLGWPEPKEFDGIIVSAKPGYVPPALLQQLKVGGRLIIPIGGQLQGWLFVIHKERSGLRAEVRGLVTFVPMVGEGARDVALWDAVDSAIVTLTLLLVEGLGKNQEAVAASVDAQLGRFQFVVEENGEVHLQLADGSTSRRLSPPELFLYVAARLAEIHPEFPPQASSTVQDAFRERVAMELASAAQPDAVELVRQRFARTAGDPSLSDEERADAGRSEQFVRGFRERVARLGLAEWLAQVREQRKSHEGGGDSGPMNEPMRHHLSDTWDGGSIAGQYPVPREQVGDGQSGQAPDTHRGSGPPKESTGPSAAAQGEEPSPDGFQLVSITSEHDGHQIWAHVKPGRGRPVLFIHGIGGDQWHALRKGHFFHRFLPPDFLQDRPLIIMHLRGYQPEGVPQPPMSGDLRAANARDIATVIGRFADRSRGIDLVMHSAGNIYGLTMLARNELWAQEARARIRGARRQGRIVFAYPGTAGLGEVHAPDLAGRLPMLVANWAMRQAVLYFEGFVALFREPSRIPELFREGLRETGAALEEAIEIGRALGRVGQQPAKAGGIQVLSWTSTYPPSREWLEFERQALLDLTVEEQQRAVEHMAQAGILGHIIHAPLDPLAVRTTVAPFIELIEAHGGTSEAIPSFWGAQHGPQLSLDAPIFFRAVDRALTVTEEQLARDIVEGAAAGAEEQATERYRAILPGPVVAPRAGWQYRPEDFAVVNDRPDQETWMQAEGLRLARRQEDPEALYYLIPRVRAKIRAALRVLVPAGGRVLDLMTGFATYLPENRSPDTVVGLGLAPAALAQNEALAGAVVHDVNANPTLPFKDAAFDAVTLVSGIFYLRQPVEVFREIARVLKPGGIVVIIWDLSYLPEKIAAIWQANRYHPDLASAIIAQAGGFSEVRQLEAITPLSASGPQAQQGDVTILYADKLESPLVADEMENQIRSVKLPERKI